MYTLYKVGKQVQSEDWPKEKFIKTPADCNCLNWTSVCLLWLSFVYISEHMLSICGAYPVGTIHVPRCAIVIVIHDCQLKVLRSIFVFIFISFENYLMYICLVLTHFFCQNGWCRKNPDQWCFLFLSIADNVSCVFVNVKKLGPI